jgi:Protein of unknown function (DUF3551)
MKLQFVGVLAALVAAGAPDGPVSAQQARIYKYCLEQGSPARFPLMTCYYETLQQCMASKTSISDRCMINPQWAARRQ